MILTTYQIISRQNSDLHRNSSPLILHVEKLNEFPLNTKMLLRSAHLFPQQRRSVSVSRYLRRAGVCVRSRAELGSLTQNFVWLYFDSLSYIRLI